ncbi:hypothetical protein [Lentilactobacillus parakefiri]|uniref:Uncharacterized protein n=1 Tax=Lentilactobacillus parakefiri TaxID=152332 RepID=A0A224V5S0_9LACO|nr:hypothetical protein [Lentilactobacillus parakefiri]KRL72589.1 hypothetical protein FD08_GL003596 [Lentilactobacillus parakefiri DSM 10551]PAL00793.1 hypothetical protein B8W96_04930 [Lentilactobacillus parakefiri]TDG94718.1 hypothetical protein C5L28_001003 [Lentilactobacillus parakefiri]GAW72326.1 hypothetical protein LPKJCM_01439 [Lentilactobacillus parakefiri]
MRPILPNKTEFVPHAPENEHEIFSGMRTYPDNVKVYHPHGTIDATSVFWHNKLHPNALNFAVYVDPKATERAILFQRVYTDIQKLAWKFDDDRMITRDYAPQHPFNQWLSTRGFHLVQTKLIATVDLIGLSLGNPVGPGTLKTFAEISRQDQLYQHILGQSMSQYAGKPAFNPAITISLPDWSALISHRQMSTAPFALIQDGHLAAFSFLYDFDDRSVELGQMNGVNASALNRLLNQQLKWLQDHDQILAGEFEMANRLEMKIFQSLPFKDVNKYEAYMRLA